MYNESDKKRCFDATKKLTCDNDKEILKFMSTWMNKDELIWAYKKKITTTKQYRDSV